MTQLTKSAGLRRSALAILAAAGTCYLGTPVAVHAQNAAAPAAGTTDLKGPQGDSDFANVNLDDLLDTKVIFSASKRAQTIDDSPNAISVVTADDIKAMGAVNLIDVFRRLPGVYVYVRSGNNPLLSIRGRSSGYPSGYLLLIDGVSIYDATNGGIDWSRAPVVLEDIERIELIRGPGGTLYGSNAFYGVINVITKRPENDSTVRSVTTGGTQGVVQQYASASIKSDTAAFRLSGKFQQSDGFDKGAAKKNPYDGKTLGNVLLRSDFKLTDKTDLALQMSAQFGVRDTLGASINHSDHSNPTFQGYYYGGLKHKFNSDNTVEFKTYAFTMQEKLHVPTSYAPASDHFYSELTSINNEFVWSHAISSDVDLLAGAHHRYLYSYGTASAFVGLDLSNGFDLNSPKNFSVPDRPRINQQTASGYAQIEVRESRWLVFNSGVRFEYDTFTDSVNPSPRVSVLLRPAEDHTFRISAARSTRIPSVIEHKAAVALFPAIGTTSALLSVTGNAKLNAENITDFELGYRGNFFGRKVTANVETFFQHIQNAIADRGNIAGYSPYTFFGNPIPIYQYDNNEDFRAAGAEIEVTANPVNWQMVRVNYTYTKEYSKESNHDVSDVTGTHSFRNTTPAHMFNFVSETTFPTHTKLYLGGSYHSVFRAIDNLFNQAARVDNGFRFDVTASQSFFDDKVTLSVIGQNVLETEGPNFMDELDLSSPGYPKKNRAPQSVFGRLEVKL